MTTLDGLHSLIAKGESETLELKRSIASRPPRVATSIPRR